MKQCQCLQGASLLTRKVNILVVIAEMLYNTKNNVFTRLCYITFHSKLSYLTNGTLDEIQFHPPLYQMI